MDADTWIYKFRKAVLNTSMNCFDGLFQYSPLDRISYPTLALRDVLNVEEKKKLKSDQENQFLESAQKEKKIPPIPKWLSEYPSFWNELRLWTHHCIRQIVTGKNCLPLAFTCLKNDAALIQDQEFQQFWLEIYEIILEADNRLKENKVKDADSQNKTNLESNEEGKPKRNPQNMLDKTNTVQFKNSQTNLNEDDYKKAQIQEYNHETKCLKSKSEEMLWKIQVVKTKFTKFSKNFNKLNLAYLFLRNYNILNISDFIRKKLQIECSRPQKFNYYNILNTLRIYQEKQKLVKGTIRQYKYKRRDRTMSADDNENAIRVPKNRKIKVNEIENDRQNIKCEIKAALINYDTEELLRLSIDKRIKLLTTEELTELGYFKAMNSMKETNQKNEELENKELEKK